MKSILQKGRYCFLTGNTREQLHKHHIFNGPLRNWSEKNGLWVYLSWTEHDKLHRTNANAKRLKAIAQYFYEKTHSHEEFMSHTHENYSMYLTVEDKLKYCIGYQGLDCSQPISFKMNSYLYI